MKKQLAKVLLAFLLSTIFFSSISVAQTNDSVVMRLTTLRDDFVNKIKATGYNPTLQPPEIIIDTPASYRTFGNYNDTTNTLHTTGDWKTLSPDLQDFFNNPANRIGNGETGKSFFEKSIHKWIFIHEMGHWWRACQHQKATAYDEEQDANRIAVAYWRGRDSSFMNFMFQVFQDVVNHFPNPVPAGESKEKYLNDHFDILSAGPVYTWYQAQMIVEAYNEKPILTFKEAVKDAGNKVY